MKEYKLIIAGGRDFKDYAHLSRVVFALAEDIPGDTNLSMVCGMARGADLLGSEFAANYELPVHRFPADWTAHGKAAGHIRNRQMGDFADALLAFWDGKSPGTKGMIEYMQKLGKPVTVVNY